MRDGTKLRVNVFRPELGGRFPVIMCAQPYGKDVLPWCWPIGYLPPARYRFIRQPDPITFSAYTTWESPDPSYWVSRGAVLGPDPILQPSCASTDDGGHLDRSGPHC